MVDARPAESEPRVASKAFWAVRRSCVIPRVQTNFIKTAEVADTPHKWYRSIDNIISMCLGTGAVPVAAAGGGEAQMYSPAVKNGSSDYFQRNLL